MARTRYHNLFNLSAFKIGVLVFFISLLILYFFFIHGDYGLYHYWKLKKEKDELELKIKALKAEQAALKKEIDSLKHNKQYIEKMARERYKMGREGERVYYVSPDSQQKK